MSNLNLQEQEQIDQVKYFWKDYGKYIITLVTLLVIGYVSNSVYNWYQENQAQKAAKVYVNFTTALTAKQTKEVISITDNLVNNFGSTEYAPMAALQTAKMVFSQKDYTKAEKYLLWTKDHSQDSYLQSVAILRLASLYIDQQRFDKARELLRTKHERAFDGLFYEGRGDLYIAQGDLNKARDAYKEGLQKAANDPSTQQAIQMKLEIIGS